MTKTRQRIERLFDPHSFVELYPEQLAGYVVGHGLIGGRKVYVCATNTEHPTWTLLATLVKEIVFLEYLREHPAPVVFIIDAQKFSSTSVGKSPVPADADELQTGPNCVGRAFYLQARLQRQIPMLGILCAEVAASLSFPLTLCDAVVMVDGSAMCIGRPDVVKLMVGEDASIEELGGASMHCAVSGLGHMYASSEEAAIDWTQRYLSCFPDQAEAPLPLLIAQEPAFSEVPLEQIVPKDCLSSFKMLCLIESVIDRGTLVEIKKMFAQSAITALARIEGRVCGLVANDPAHFGGILFPDACRKMIEFIRLCDAYGIPLVFLVDTPGFMVGKASEEAGSIKAGSDLFAAIAQCRTKRLCLVVRKAYSAGFYAMGGAGFSPAKLLALPTASITIYGRKALELLAADGQLTEEGRYGLEQMLKDVENPWRLESRGLIDRVIDWQAIRPELAAFLRGN